MLKQLLEKKKALAHEIESIRKEWKGKEGTMPPDVEERLDKALGDFDANDAKIAREEKSLAVEKWASQESEDNAPVGNAGDPVVQRKAHDDARHSALMKTLKGAMGLGAPTFTDAERKAMQGDDWGGGGMLLTPQTFLTQVLKNVDDRFKIRGLATVYPGVSPSGLGIPTLESDVDDADWTTELGGSNATELKLGKRELIPKELKKAVLVGRKLLANTTLDFESFIMQRIAYKVGKPQEAAFTTGDGFNKPLGVFTESTDGISSGRNVDTAANNAIVGDDFIEALFNLKEQYMEQATWLLHRSVVKIVRKLKTTGSGEYIWNLDGLTGKGAVSGLSPTIVGRPYTMSEFAPSNVAAGQPLAMVGDFSFYWIADGENMFVQKLLELYARTSQVGFHIESSCDGMPVLEEAFVRMKYKA